MDRPLLSVASTAQHQSGGRFRPRQAEQDREDPHDRGSAMKAWLVPIGAKRSRQPLQLPENSSITFGRDHLGGASHISGQHVMLTSHITSRDVYTIGLKYVGKNANMVRISGEHRGGRGRRDMLLSKGQTCLIYEGDRISMFDKCLHGCQYSLLFSGNDSSPPCPLPVPDDNVETQEVSSDDAEAPAEDDTLLGERGSGNVADGLAAPPAKISHSERMARLIECPLCFGILVSPVLTTCGHSFCKLCWEGIPLEKNRRTRTCPSCMGKVETTSRNLMLKEMVETMVTDGGLDPGDVEVYEQKKLAESQSDAQSAAKGAPVGKSSGISFARMVTSAHRRPPAFIVRPNARNPLIKGGRQPGGSLRGGPTVAQPSNVTLRNSAMGSQSSSRPAKRPAKKARLHPIEIIEADDGSGADDLAGRSRPLQTSAVTEVIDLT